MHSALRTTLFATCAAAASFGAPTAAQAAYTGDGSRLVGDAASDNLVIGVNAGLYTHNQTGGGFTSNVDFNTTLPGDQTIASTESLVILAGDGDDAVTGPTVASGTLGIVGEGGNDVLTGGRGADAISGGAGDDRVIGAPGGDLLAGDAGNDTLVWNNGDGSDTMRGGAGNDEIEVNGAPTAGDVFRVTGAAAPAIAQEAPQLPADILALFTGETPNITFRRTNLGPFALDISSSERMTLNGAGGSDDIAADASVASSLLLTANGGTGDDTLTGTPGADLLNGGDGNDTLSGAGGDDRLVGDRGADTMNGGAGDDTTVWNNGDGSDVMNGDDGADRVEVNGATAAGDAFTVAPNGARALFRRTNLGPFSLDIGTAEALDANGLGGDDTFSADAGIAALLALDIDGGSGNDTIAGAEGDDTLAGGSGNDTITPGGGADVADGGDGDDQLLGRDGAGDLLRCGAGNDAAQTDQAGVDVVSGCEATDVLPPAAPQAPNAGAAGPKVTIGSLKGRKRNGRHSVRFTVSCPAAAANCTADVRLTTASSVIVGGVRVKVLLASRSVTVNAGTRRTISVQLPKGAQRFARARSLRLIVGIGDQSVKRTVKLAK